MSDGGEDIPIPDDGTDVFDREIDDNEGGPEEEAARNEKEVQRNFGDEDEEDEEEEADYDDEEDEDEEDLDSERPKKKSKHRHKRPAVNRFIDLEAEVDEEEDEEEEEEEYGRDEFIAETGVEGEEEDPGRRAANHARLDRRERELDDQDLAKIAQDLNKRYGRATVRYTGDMNEVPQRLLMPSVHDASLWQVRVKPGRERDIVFSLMRKAIDLEYTARPLSILSAFQRDSLPGMIYVEARSSQQVSQACSGLVGVYPSRGNALVPIEEMASLLQIKKQDTTVTQGSWVRFKRGKYQGDLAQVLDVLENGEDVGLKFLPRIDFSPRDDTAPDGRKRKKASGPASMRPPQGMFNYEEVIKVYGRKQVSRRNQVYVFQGDTFKDGFLEKDVKLSGLVLEDVSPTLDEIAQFTRNQDGETDNNVDLSIIAEASRKAAVLVLQPGDHVEVFEGEQSGVHGVVESINQDVVTITAIGVDIDGQKVDVPARSVRKKFKAGDHVKVMTGQNADETGLVVNVADNIVTFLSDMSMNEVSVFSKDLREAAEVGSSTNTVGNYELHDLVQLDLQTVGVIFKTERDSFRVLDQNGQVRLVQPHQISMRRDSNRAIATDSEGHELRIHDNMKEVDGEGRKGTVLHIHQSFFAFIHNRDIIENGGVFVTRARNLISLSPKGNLIKTAGMDLTKMNPAMAAPGAGGLVGQGGMGRGPRDRLIGVTVTVVKGAHKGYVGVIKDTNGPMARVELHTGNKVITIEKEKLRRRNPNGSIDPLEGGGFGNATPRASNFGSTPNHYGQGGGRTPSWGANAGRTPNPYAQEGRTPAWTASSRTPNPYAADSGKTPAWNASSRTPNPYAQDGGKTPAWNATARTPNPYASAGGSNATGGWGGATPKPAVPSAWGDAGGAWGGSSPSWGSGNTYSAPTPAAGAPTPAAGAPTPLSAPTPGASGFYSADTPWGSSFADGSAQTPASAPTPAATVSYDRNGLIRYAAPELWLVDSAFKGKHVVVEIVSRAAGSWDRGEHDGVQGYITSVFDVRNDTLTRTAQMIPLSAGHDKSKAINSIPLQYLLPVHPTKPKEHAIVMEGDKKGSEVVLREEGSAGKWFVGPYQDSFSWECAGDRLVRLQLDVPT